MAIYNVMAKIKGIYFDLGEIFLDLNERFFSRQIEANLIWGRNGPKKRNQVSIRLASYHPQSKTITINPILDKAIVPKFCLERILFHEMAHQQFPSKKSLLGRNIAHHKEFKNFEKNYPYLKEADKWLKDNINKL